MAILERYGLKRQAGKAASKPASPVEDSQGRKFAALRRRKQLADLPGELWLRVIDFPGYEVSSEGRVRHEGRLSGIHRVMYSKHSTVVLYIGSQPYVRRVDQLWRAARRDAKLSS